MSRAKAASDGAVLRDEVFSVSKSSSLYVNHGKLYYYIRTCEAEIIYLQLVC